jgi:FAD/FMN-containing dehydrogenase
MLIDLSRLNEVSFDPDAGVASVQPGAKGRDLNIMLADHSLFFPSGHCPSVGIGGFLLQGGWGWNSRSIGPACMSIVAIDVVTAGGELIRADANQNSDYWWAARGAGGGYFGVVTRFHLRCHPRPSATYTRIDVYGLDVIDEVLSWALEFEPTQPPEFEFAILGTTPTLPDGRTVHDGTALMIMCQALMYSDDDARASLARLDECPVLDRALHREEAKSVSFTELYDGPNAVEPEGVRWSADGMWTNAKGSDLIEPAKQLFHDVPTPESHVFWYPWRQQEFEDAAISVQGDLYLAAFSGWHDPTADGHYVAWPTGHMQRMESLSEGIQLADENLGQRGARYLSDENGRRLEALRAEHDPEGRFHSYLTTERESW